MPISKGFYKKVYPWLIGEDSKDVLYRPFLTKGNPYKSRIFLVSSHAVPLFKVEDRSGQIFAESLVNRELFHDLYLREIKGAPREFKGSLQFENWLEKQHQERLIYASLNTYQLKSADEAKVAKKEDTANYERGNTIFNEVLEEFQPEIIILQGTAAYEQFKARYADRLAIFNEDVTKVQLLEQTGPFAEMVYEDGKKVWIFVTRSMSYFGADGLKFEQFKENLAKLLENNA